MIAAYQGAYPNCKTRSAALAGARRLLKLPEIQARLKELQEEAAKTSVVTVESLIADLDEIRSLTLEAKNCAAAVSAIVAKAKLAGLLNEGGRAMSVNMNALTVDDRPKETYEQWVVRRTREIEVDGDTKTK
jgi:hypothetical protein